MKVKNIIIKAIVLFGFLFLMTSCDKIDSIINGGLSSHSHTWEQGVVIKEATCSEEGEMSYVCTTCDESKIEKIEKIPHEEIIIEGKEATCQEFGLSEGKYCNVCKEIIVEQQPIGLLSHDYDEDYSCVFCGCQYYTKELIYEYSDELDAYAVAGIYKELSEVVIPSTYKNKPVIKILEHAFYGQEKIKKIYIPDSIIDIGEMAFSNTSIDSLTIPNGIKKIQWGTFSGCRNLKSVTIPNSVIKLEREAFSECTALHSITIPNSVIEIGEQAFNGCENLKNVFGCKNLEIIGELAFTNCYQLENISIPNSIKYVGSGALSIVIRNNILEEDGIAYLGNEENPYVILLEVVEKNDKEKCINSNTKIIYNNAFESCMYLKNIEIPNGVIQIGDYAFSGCESLTSIEIPDGVIHIGNNAFSGCVLLTSIEIPASVLYIGERAFDCSSINDIVINNYEVELFSNSFVGNFTMYENSYYLGVKDNPYAILMKGSISGDTINIHPDTKIIANGACSKNRTIKYIEIPQGVKYIGKNAFYECKFLERVVIPSSVIRIGESAFTLCTILESVKLSNGIKEIESSAFSFCEYLTDIYIPLSVEKIGSYVFEKINIRYEGTKEQWKKIEFENHPYYDDSTIEYNCTE